MRAGAFGLEAASVDGQDVRAVHAAASKLVARARSGAGPAFLLCNTIATTASRRDINREYYRSKAEEQTWKTDRDPIANFKKWLLAQQIADAAALDRMQAELESEMQKAVDFAIAAPTGSGEVNEDVYA